jgi:hypothetical protein
MTIKLLILSLALGVFTGTDQPVKHDRFASYVLNDFDRYSAFLAVDVISDEYSGPVIIQNGDLYYFLNQTSGFNKAKYKASMTKLLLTKAKLRIGKTPLSKWGFLKVSKSDGVLGAGKNGAGSFVSHYFTNGVLNDGIADEDRNAIISTLFEWRIPSRIDDLTGYLVILRLTLSNSPRTPVRA